MNDVSKFVGNLTKRMPPIESDEFMPSASEPSAHWNRVSATDGVTADVIVSTGDVAIQIYLPHRPITQAEADRLAKAFDNAREQLVEMVEAIAEVKL